MYLQVANLQSGRPHYTENDYRPSVIPTHVATVHDLEDRNAADNTTPSNTLHNPEYYGTIIVPGFTTEGQ